MNDQLELVVVLRFLTEVVVDLNSSSKAIEFDLAAVEVAMQKGHSHFLLSLHLNLVGFGSERYVPN